MNAHDRFSAWFKIRCWYLDDNDSLSYLFRAELDCMNREI